MNNITQQASNKEEDNYEDVATTAVRDLVDDSDSAGDNFLNFLGDVPNCRTANDGWITKLSDAHKEAKNVTPVDIP